MSNARRKLVWSLFLSFPLLVKANSANSPLPLVMDNFHSSFRFSMCSPMWYDYIRYIDRPLIGWVAPLKTICCNSDVMLRQWFSTVPPLDLWWAACPQSKWPIIYMYSLDHISRTECKRRGVVFIGWGTFYFSENCPWSRGQLSWASREPGTDVPAGPAHGRTGQYSSAPWRYTRCKGSSAVGQALGPPRSLSESNLHNFFTKSLSCSYQKVHKTLHRANFLDIQYLKIWKLNFSIVGDTFTA